MENPKTKPTLSQTIGPVLFGVLFLLFIILGGAITFFLQPNLNGIGGILFSLICAFPLSIILLVRFRQKNNFKWYITYVLPALVFPLCIALFLGWTAFEQRPTNIFKVFVADPIPAGVSNIQAYDISVGIDSTIILAFNATPEAVDEIIEINKLTPSDYEEPDSYFETFDNINTSQEWDTYSFYDGSINITM